MKKNQQLVLGAVALVGIGGYLIVSYFKKNKAVKSKEDEIIADLVSNPEAIKNNVHLSTQATFPMKLGSKGKQVAVLQQYLNNEGYPDPKLVVDGIWGEKTEMAVTKLLQYPYKKDIAEWRTKALLERKLSGNQITREFYDKFVMMLPEKPTAPSLFKF
jgi:peptidoglycan hydrolase-like protein with peptidoglycan-binding domain